MRLLTAIILIAAAVLIYQQFVDPTLFGLIDQSTAEQAGAAAEQAAEEMQDAAGAAGEAAGDAADAVTDAAEDAAN